MDEERIIINGHTAIPLSELSFRFARSSGPGGQHVNRSETQVELLFDLANSPHLTESQRQRARQKLGGYLDSRGTLHIVASGSRSQYRNRQEAILRFQQLLRQALRVPKIRRPTQPTRAARERRLSQKRWRGEIKRSRRWIEPGDW